jgi:hypothetical protein
MEYKINSKQLKLANKLGVMIYPADKKSKYKIEIYDSQGLYMFSIGDKHYNDYFLYSEGEKNKELPKGYAKWRRSLYLQRHEKELDKIGSRGWFSAVILWDYPIPKENDKRF